MLNHFGYMDIIRREFTREADDDIKNEKKTDCGNIGYTMNTDNIADISMEIERWIIDILLDIISKYNKKIRTIFIHSIFIREDSIHVRFGLLHSFCV